MDDFEVERLDGLRREVLRVEGHQHLGTTADGGGEDVPILLVVRHRQYQVVVAGDHRVGEIVLHRADALLDERRVLTVLHEVLRQLEQHILRPQRPEQSTVSEFEDEVVEQCPVENVGIEEGGKAHSASSSARRFTAAGLPT